MKNNRFVGARVLAGLVMIACHDTTAADVNGTVSVSITPTPGIVVQCNTVQLHAVVQNASGGSITPDSVTWRSSNSVAAPISASGLLSGMQSVSPDTVTTTAFVGGTAHKVQTIWSVAANASAGHCS